MVRILTQFKNYFIKFSFVLLLLFNVLRLIILIRERNSIHGFSEYWKIFSYGFLADLVPLLFFISVLIFLSLIVPPKIHQLLERWKIKQVLLFSVIAVLVFSCLAEYFFWVEFTTRFNFIAIDYLVYTNEVLKNVMESYPMGGISLSIFFATLLIFWILKKIKITKNEDTTYARKLVGAIFLFVMSFGYYELYANVIDSNDSENLVKQISSNGIYRLVEAFNNNEIDYLSFYKILPEKFVQKQMEDEYKAHSYYARIIKKNASVFRRIIRSGPEKRYNVVFVLVESLGGKYIGALGNKDLLTPNLDELSKHSVFFTRLFSTGTRTVRGIEATILSMPPTPGASIVRRPHNEKLYSMGSEFYERGYDEKFIYGGHSYFDNMKYFFSNNFFQIIDRANFSEEEVHFENAWGVCDEDLFEKSLKEADLSYQKKTPFLQYILTTSNHRPFTYPDNKIDIPSKSGRNGAVKYTDFAIGKFLNKAKEKPWFDNTLFVIIADHSTEGRGKFDLNLNDFHIPAWMYGPKIIKPQVIHTPVSQIDILPSILGLLNFSYESHFMGNDIFDPKIDKEGDIFIGNYQNVGFYEDGFLVSLGPKKTSKQYNYNPEKMIQEPIKEINTKSIEILNEAISDYQFASEQWTTGQLKE